MNKRILEPENIFVDMAYSTKEEVLKFLAEKAYELGYSSHQEQTYQDLVKREQEFNTALDDVFAIPHTKSDSIIHTGILLVRFKDKVVWGEQSVQLAICFLAPTDHVNEHLILLSKLSRKLIYDDFKEMLLNCNQDEIFKQLESVFDADAEKEGK